MDKSEARTVLAGQLAAFRTLPYAALVERLLDRQEVTEVIGASGCRYQLEFEAFWDAGPNSVLRVSGSIDDGGWRAWLPITDDFLISPDGSFVGE